MPSESSVANPDAVLDHQSGVDKIHLLNMDANPALAGDQAFTFIGSSAFNGTAGQLRAYESGGTWFVEGDTDGNGAADFAIAGSVRKGRALVPLWHDKIMISESCASYRARIFGRLRLLAKAGIGPGAGGRLWRSTAPAATTR